MSGPTHLVIDKPGKAYDPKVVEAWAREYLGVTDEAKIAGILDLYKHWDASQKHEVVTSSKGGNHEADVVMVLDRSDGEEKHPEKIVFAVSHSNPNMVFRRQRIANDKLRGMDALELGSFIISDLFEYSPEKQMGEYMYSGSVTIPDSFTDMFNLAEGRVVEPTCDRFLRSVALYLAEIKDDQGIYSLPDGRYKEYQALEKHLRAVAKEKFDTVIDRFVGSLDQDAWRTMQKANYADRTAYTWLTGRMPERFGDEKTKWQPSCASPDAIRRRRQALEAAPALVWWFAGYDRVPTVITDTLDNDGTLLQAINAGLAEIHEGRDTPPPQITQEFLSWFGQFDVTYVDGPQMQANPAFYHFGQNLPFLQAIPREWRPKTHRELKLILALKQTIADIATVVGRPTHEVFVEFLSACRNPAGLPKKIVDVDQLRVTLLVNDVKKKYGQSDYSFGDRKITDEAAAKLKITPNLLSVLPAQWLPKNPEDARTLAAICVAKQKKLEKEQSRFEDSPTLYAKLAQMLTAYADKFDAQSKKVTGVKTDKTGIMYLVLADIKKRNAIGLDTQDNDFYTHIGNQIILTEIFRQATANGYTVAEILADEQVKEISPKSWGVGGDMVRTIFAGMTAAKVKSLTDRWHAREARLHTRNTKYDKPADWLPLFKKFERGGVVYECLTSTAALVQEAKEMGHCVRGYTPNCVIQNSHIITIKAKDGSWRATLEVTEDKGGGSNRQIRHVQLEGPDQVRNDKLPKEQQDAAAWIISHVNKGSRNVDWRAIDERRAIYRKDELLLRIGFEYADTAACDNAYDVWRANFRDIFKEPTREEFLRGRGITDMIQKRFPKRVLTA